MSLIGLSLLDMPFSVLNGMPNVSKGSLASSVANAMLSMAGLKRDDRFLDPMCGTGILPISAAYQEARSKGSDISSEKIEAAKKNAAELGVPVDFSVLDATSTGLHDGSFDVIASNIPFGKEVDLPDEEIFFRKLDSEFRRLCIGNIVILTKHPDFFSYSNRYDILNSGLKCSMIMLKR